MIKITDDNRNDLIASCLIEAANVLSESMDKNKQIQDLKDQIDHFKQTGYGNIKTAEKRLEKLESDKRYQDYFNKHEDELIHEPKLKMSKDGKKTLFEYKSDKVDSNNGEITLSKNISKFVYAEDGKKARDLLVRRFSISTNNKDIGINAQDIKKVYENE